MCSDKLGEKEERRLVNKGEKRRSEVISLDVRTKERVRKRSKKGRGGGALARLKLKTYILGASCMEKEKEKKKGGGGRGMKMRKTRTVGEIFRNYGKKDLKAEFSEGRKTQS